MSEPVPPRSAQGRRVLVVEDEYLVADDLRQELEEAGVAVLGPVGSVDQAMSLLAAGGVDAAILDLNLGEEMAYPLADRLREQGVPLVFATGYDASAIPEAYAGIPRCEKPYDAGQCLRMLFGREP